MKKVNQLAMLFDLDGTLINTLPDICGHINKVRVDYGFSEKSEAEICGYIGLGMPYLIKGAFYELPETEHEKAMEKFRAYYYECPHISGFIYEGVEDTLKLLKEWRCKIAVVTNKPKAIAEKTLAYYLPQISFHAISGADSVSIKKPHPNHILETLKLIDASAPDAIYVGDHEVDKLCAMAAGVNFLGALYGFGGVKSSLEEGLNSFFEIIDIVKARLNLARDEKKY